MANIDLEEFARKLKLIKIVAPSRQWQSWSPFNKTSAVTKAFMTVNDG